MAETKKASSPEKRKLRRRHFSYYMRVMDESTGKLVGHLSDISTGGFRLDCGSTVPPNMDFTLRIDLSPDVASKDHMVFVARSRWCNRDKLDPMTYNVGFQIVNMIPSDFEIFARMFERYGSERDSTSNMNYLWR